MTKEVEYTEEQPDKLSESTGKYIGSGLSVLGVKNLVMKGDFIFHCGSCDTDIVYAEYKGKKNFNFRVLDDLRLDIGYCSNCDNKRQSKNRENTLFRLSSNYRNRTSSAFRLGGYQKGTKTEKMLGINFNSLKKYLENQFVEGMSWNNYGKWHIDHIVPVSSANTEEELKLYYAIIKTYNLYGRLII